MAATVGFDLGSQKCMIVVDNGDIVLTSTGSTSRPTCVAFVGKTRLVGDEAAAVSSNDSKLMMFNNLLGKSSEDVASLAIARSFFRSVTVNDQGNLSTQVTYCDALEDIPVNSMVGLFLSRNWARVIETLGSEPNLSFNTPMNATPAYIQALKDSCFIAGIDESRLSFVDTSESLLSAYSRKLSALLPAERKALEGKRVLIIDMGHTQTSVVVLQVEAEDSGSELGVRKLSALQDLDLGCLQFDLQLFDHFAGIVQSKHRSEVTHGNRRGIRLLGACERVRKLLSQLNESSVSVENLTDSGDVSFSLRRDEMTQICSELLGRFKGLILSALQQATEVAGEGEVAAIEGLGGGVRMPCVQAVLTETLSSLPLGAKLSDSSLAHGAALTTNRLRSATSSPVPPSPSPSTPSESTEGADNSPTSPPTPPVDEETKQTSEVSLEDRRGMTVETLQALREREIQMQVRDAEVNRTLAAFNDLEGFIFKMRSAPRSEHGDLIDASALNALLDEVENWVYDERDIASADQMVQKKETLQAKVNELCQAYFTKVEEKKAALEAELNLASKLAEAERVIDGENGSGGGDADNRIEGDTRKLKKPERMRLAVNQKDEGTELFKIGNFKRAASHYHNSLAHCGKFFDLSPEDEKEIKSLRVTLHLNLASCYLKMESWEQLFRNCNDALTLDPENPKAYFRRSMGYEAKKDWDSALSDLKKCQELNPTEDKAVMKGLERVKKEIQKINEKEKKMWTKAFA